VTVELIHSARLGETGAEKTDEVRGKDHRQALHRRFDTRRSFGWVRFIYGNDGWDVINDYTTNLEPVIAGVNALAEKMEG
jgi:hypothetical protein